MRNWILLPIAIVLMGLVFEFPHANAVWDGRYFLELHIEPVEARQLETLRAAVVWLEDHAKFLLERREFLEPEFRPLQRDFHGNFEVEVQCSGRTLYGFEQHYVQARVLLIEFDAAGSNGAARKIMQFKIPDGRKTREMTITLR